MDHIDYFKLQAKHLLKDFKTRFFNKKEGIFEYKPQFFDITQIFLDFDLYDDATDFTFTLMNAQHIIARLAGFYKWNELINAKPAELELAHLLFDNAHKISIEEWNMYIDQAEEMNKTNFNTEEKLEIFKQVFLSADKHRSDSFTYRIDLEAKRNTQPVDLTKDDHLVLTNTYYELDNNEKYKAILEHGDNEADFGFRLNEIVECLHCGAQYKFRDVKAIRLKSEFRTKDDFDMLVCKNYPKCDGTIIDLVQIKKTKIHSLETT